MLSANDFRRIALGLEGAVEGAHMGHPDFRVGGRIFASLRGDPVTGMVALTPDQQQHFLDASPAAFSPEAGAWGRQGCTRVHLKSADEDGVGEALTLAWQYALLKPGKKTRAAKAKTPAAKAKSTVQKSQPRKTRP